MFHEDLLLPNIGKDGLMKALDRLASFVKNWKKPRPKSKTFAASDI